LDLDTGGTGGTESELSDGEEFDLVVSNIISATLVRLAGPISRVLEPGGLWIVSGIIEENWQAVAATSIGLGFVLEQELHEDGWVAARFRLGQE
jgi:ribosomal protein L11 methyltransferase